MSPCLTCPDCLCLHLMTTPYDPSPMMPRLSYLSILSELSLVNQPQTSSFWLSDSELNNNSYCWFILKHCSMTHLKILMKILIHQPLLMSSAFNWSLFSQWFDSRQWIVDIGSLYPLLKNRCLRCNFSLKSQMFHWQ